MLNAVVLEAELNSRSSRSAHFITRENRRLKEHVVERFKSSSLMSCSHSCLRYDWCTSVNFEVTFKNGKGTCELNRGEISAIDAESKLHEEQGVIFLMILKVIYKKKVFFVFLQGYFSRSNCFTGRVSVEDSSKQDKFILQDLVHERENLTLPGPRENFTASFTCDDAMEMFADGRSLGRDNEDCRRPTYFIIPGNTRLISIKAKPSKFQGGILGSFSNGLVTNESWKCTDDFYLGWNIPHFDDSNWPLAVVVAKYGDIPWGPIPVIAATAKWIWTAGPGLGTVYCRLNLP
ncbi:uncharacterized protein LOC144637620 [Oculina patagonica]